MEPRSLKAIRDANKAAEEEKAKARRKEKEAITVSDFWESVYLPSAQMTKTAHTVNTEKGRFHNWIAPAIGDVPMQKLNAAQVEAVSLHARKSGKSATTVRHILADISQIWNMAAVHGLVEGESPVCRVKKPAKITAVCVSSRQKKQKSCWMHSKSALHFSFPVPAEEMETLLMQALEMAPPLPVSADKNLKSVSTQTALPPPLTPENIFGLKQYVAKAVEDEMQGLATTPEGGRRKKLLSVVAKLGGFVSTGNLTEEILRARAEEAFQKCHPEDFDTPEVEKEFTEAFREALAYGMKCPREIPDPLPPGFSLVQSGPDAGLWYAPLPKDERDQPTKIRLGTSI